MAASAAYSQTKPQEVKDGVQEPFGLYFPGLQKFLVAFIV